MGDTILEIKDLRVLFPSHGSWLPAVDGVNFSVGEGEIIGIVGESGSGKSVMSKTILRLLDFSSNARYEGQILFEGRDILAMSGKELRALRGNDISMIFQDPLNSLSPVHTVAKQLTEVLVLHDGLNRREARVQAEEMLALTGISDAHGCMEKYPFELSGGMQQRVMIAMALACKPKLLIADEPTTALDVTIQQQILYLIRQLKRKLGMSVLFITHDMGVVAQLCDSIKVMYLGQVVEDADTQELFDSPLHPYTRGLLECIPHLETDRDRPLATIEGTVPPLSKVPAGCHFCTRCAQAHDACREGVPPLVEVRAGHFVKCWDCPAAGEV